MDLDALDKLRGALVEVVQVHSPTLYGVDHHASCHCGWVGGVGAGEPTRHLVDLLLPVVERIAAERAAAELRAVTTEITALDWSSARVLIRLRADSLDQP